MTFYGSQCTHPVVCSQGVADLTHNTSHRICEIRIVKYNYRRQNVTGTEVASLLQQQQQQQW